MIFIGDAHGKIQKLRTIIRNMPEGETAFQLGDMGIGFKGVFLYPYKNGRLRFIRGNHDSPVKCRHHPDYIGDYGFDQTLNMFYLGGAWSIDWAWRTEGISWWRDEELSVAELDKAVELYIKSKPKIVATHEAPSQAAVYMLNSIMPRLSGHAPCPIDQSVADKGEDYQYYKAKLGCANTRTSQALQVMLEAHQPEHWFFGHYHVTTNFYVGEYKTQFHCLNELDTYTYIPPTES